MFRISRLDAAVIIIIVIIIIIITDQVSVLLCFLLTWAISRTSRASSVPMLHGDQTSKPLWVGVVGSLLDLRHMTMVAISLICQNLVCTGFPEIIGQTSEDSLMQPTRFVLSLSLSRTNKD